MSKSILFLLIKYNSWTGFIPAYNVRSKTFHYSSTRAVTFIIIYILICASSFPMKFWLKRNQPAVLGLTIISSITITFISFIQVIQSKSKLYINNFKHFIELFNNFDSIIHKESNIIPQKHKINRKALRFFLIAYIMLYCVDGFAWNAEIGLKYAIGIGNEILHLNINFLMVTLECYFLCNIKSRYDHLFCYYELLENSQCIDNILKLHCILCRMVEYFNLLFSWHILLKFIYVIINILTVFGYIITGQIMMTTSVMLITFLFLIKITVEVVMLAVLSEMIVGQGRRLHSMTHEKLCKFVNVPNLREKLNILSNHVSSAQPYFHAAGFFAVNHAIIFTLFNLMTTYVIVVVQLHDQVQ